MTESKQVIPKSYTKQEILALCAELTITGLEELVWEFNQKIQERSKSPDAMLIKRILELFDTLTFGEQIDLKVACEEQHADDNEWIRAQLDEAEDDFANGRFSTADEVFARLEQEAMSGPKKILISKSAEEDLKQILRERAGE